MNDLKGMQMLHSLQHVTHILRGSSFIETSNFIEKSIELTAICILHNNVNLTFIKKESEHPENILVFYVTMNFKFSSELIDDITISLKTPEIGYILDIPEIAYTIYHCICKRCNSG